MGLFTPIWMTRNIKKQDKAIDAVKKIKDQDMLYKIACDAPLDDVRVAATMQITDQGMLEKLASVFKDIPVNLAAIPRLTNIELVHKIHSFECESDEIREAALKVIIEHQNESFRKILENMKEKEQLRKDQD